MKKYAFKDSINGSDIKFFREINNLSRKELAGLLKVSTRTIESWENSKNSITGPIVPLFRLLEEYPEYLDKYLIPEKKYPLRLYYMEKENINTVIDVDMLNRKVTFKNYTNNTILRAFGNKEEVTYEEFEEFLESRCFPKTRDKMKIQLELIGVPFYDPLLIIEKTKGKMADDDCYIEIVRGENND